MRPFYTEHNTRAAYQLNWSYTLFWRQQPLGDAWLAPLRKLMDRDGIRILGQKVTSRNASQFLVSTKPGLAPDQIARRVKGRLQHLVRIDCPKAFRRNYCLQSIGSTRRDKLETYLRYQLEHHGQWREREALYDLQVNHPDVDLSRWRCTAHSRFRYNLHLCFRRHQGGGRQEIEQIRSMLIRFAREKQVLLRCGAVLMDHIHALIGCRLEQPPQDIALSCLNNLAFACGMRPVFKYSYYVGTVGDYDLGAILARK